MAGDTTNLGQVTVTAIRDLPWMPGAPGVMFPQVPADQWEQYKDFLNERGHLECMIGGFLVRSSGKTIIIDTGVGKKPRGMFRTEDSNFLGNLAAQDVRPQDVDLVVTTHLHGDHVGWNCLPQGEAWAPAFPNARYLAPKGDWDYYLDPTRVNETMQELVAPLQSAGVLDLVDDGMTITPELTFYALPGHCPGHMGVMVESQGKRGLFIGDLGHSPVQFLAPEYSRRGDMDVPVASATRRRVSDLAAGEGVMLMGSHFPYPAMGYVEQVGDRREWHGPHLTEGK